MHLTRVRAQKNAVAVKPLFGVISLTPPPNLAEQLHCQPKTTFKVTMKSTSAIIFAVLGAAAIADGDAAGIFAPSSSVARPRGFLPAWGLPKHESILDRVSLFRAAVG